MATTIRITLLSGSYGLTAPGPVPLGQAAGLLDYPPSPWSLLQILLHAHPNLGPVVFRLAEQAPLFHLPYGQMLSRHDRRRAPLEPLWFGVGAALHVRWPVELAAEDERLLNGALAELCCLGRPEDTALWQVVPSMPEPNCIPAADGSLQLLCGMASATDAAPQPGSQPRERWVRYRFNPSRQRPPLTGATATLANRAVYGVEASLALPAAAGIAWTDRLHRALLQRVPGSSLFAGLAAGRPLPEDQRPWYRWEADQGRIVVLEVLSPQPFTAAELDGLTGLRLLFGPGGMRVPLRLLQLDAQPPGEARCVRTATPLLLYTTPRPGKLQRSPAAQAIQTLLWGLGEQGKLDPLAFVPEGPEAAVEEVVSIQHPRLGRLRAQTWPASETQLITSRGDRRAASCRGYHAVIAADQPLPLLAVGWGRHFGAGRLVALDPGDHRMPDANP